MESPEAPKAPKERVSREERIRNEAELKVLQDTLEGLKKRSKLKYFPTGEIELRNAEQRMKELENFETSEEHKARVLEKSDKRYEELRHGKASNTPETEPKAKKLPELRDKGIEDDFARGAAAKETASTIPSSEARPAPPPPPPAPAETIKTSKPVVLNEDLGAEHGVQRHVERGPLAPGEIDTTLSEGEKKVLRLVLTTRGSEAMQAMQKSLLKGSPSSDEKHDKGLVFAEAMYKNEKTYFTALKKFQKEKGFHHIALDKLDSNGIELPKELAELRQKWINSGAEYASHMREGAIKRLDEKRPTGLDRDEVLKRYQRRIIRKEIVVGAVEAEQRARAEGLKSRDKKGLEKLFDKYSSMSKPARVLISSALMGAFGAAAIAGGSVLGTVGFVMAVPAAITAAIALFQKDPKAKERLGNIAGGFGLVTVGGIFGTLGELAARGTHKLFGTERKAEKRLKKTENLGNLADSATLTKEFNQRSDALRAKEIIDSNARVARLGAGFTGGIGAGAVINQGIGAMGGAEGFGFGGGPHFEFGHSINDHLSIGDHIGHTNINDGDKLLGHFAEKLHANDYPTGHEPPAVHRLYELLRAKGHSGFLSGEDHAAVQLGFERPDGSTVMQPGDTIGIHNDQIVLDRPGHPEMHHVLIDSGGHPHPLDHNVWHRMPVHHQVQPAEHSAAAHSETPDHSTTVEGRDLNAAAPEPKYDILDSLKRAQMHTNLVAEYPHAHAAYLAGLQTPEQIATYNTYLDHYNAYSGPAGHIATPSVPVAGAGHLSPVTPEIGHPHSFESAPTHAETPPAQAPLHPVETGGSTGHAEQGSIKAFEAAKVAPVGTEVPYLSHSDPQHLHWNTWVSDGNGHVHERLMVDEANGKPLLPPVGESGSRTVPNDLTDLY